MQLLSKEKDILPIREQYRIFDEILLDRIQNLMPRLMRECGVDMWLVICRELTKKYEEAYSATFSEALKRYEEEEPKGECVLVIEGRSISQIREEISRSWDSMSLAEHVAYYEAQGETRKEAMRLAARDRGISRRDVYQELMR